MVMIEGILWKWTNYLSGWQPRWFVLDYGVLAYYRSQEEIHLGCRGSVKMSCCEILINNNDPVRIDLKIPPENFLYLKATTPAERQKWLVALGTSKACLVDTNYEEQQLQVNSIVYVKDKMKELLMCQSIMQTQIHLIKDHTGNAKENQVLTEATALLSATCDNFLTNVQDIMEIIEDNLSLSSASSSPFSTHRISKSQGSSRKRSKSISSQSLSSDSIGDDKSMQSKQSSAQSNRYYPRSSNNVSRNLMDHNTRETKEVQQIKDMTVEEIVDQQIEELTQTMDSTVSSVSSTGSGQSEHSLISLDRNKKTSERKSTIENISLSPPKTEQSSSSPKKRGKSVFGVAEIKFEDVELTEAGLIPTQIFLKACTNILPVFDSLGSTTFAPVKMDIQGNIHKIQTKYDTDVMAFEFLQNILSQEIRNKETNARNSATDALLWLKRALEFILIFLSEVSKGQKELPKAAETAYSRSLRKYHGWMVRGVFALAVKACPYYNDFIYTLSMNKETGVRATESDVLEEMSSSIAALERILKKLNSYYRKNKLDTDAVV